MRTISTNVEGWVAVQSAFEMTWYMANELSLPFAARFQSN
jgi:hypothetical protein